jgi:hypothetical protein
MNIITQVALLAGLIAFVSLLWLVGRAFGKHLLWGLAVLFLSPLASTAFGIRYWREEKGPFLVHVTTLVVAVTLGLYEFAAGDGWTELRAALRAPHPATFHAPSRAVGMTFVPTSLNAGSKPPAVQEERGIAKGTNPARIQPVQQEASAPATSSETRANTETGTPMVSSAKPIEPKISFRASYVPIDPSMAADYVGSTVKVKRLNRPEQDCVLRRVSPTTLAFEQHKRGGTFSFEYRQSDIEKLRVLVKQAY